MYNELRKYEMTYSQTSKSVIFSAYFYNANELDNPNRVLLNLDKEIHCSNANTNCTNCDTLKKFIDEFREIEQ